MAQAVLYPLVCQSVAVDLPKSVKMHALALVGRVFWGNLPFLPNSIRETQ